MPPISVGTGEAQVRSRQGRAPNGMVYTIYSDGSGSLREDASPLSPGWDLKCKTDAMTDKRSCVAFGNQLMVMFQAPPTAVTVCALRHDFPGRTGAVRVDDGVPHETSRSGCLSRADEVNEVMRGRKAVVRFVQFPRDYHVDQSQDLRGLREAADLAAFMLAKLNTLTF